MKANVRVVVAGVLGCLVGAGWAVGQGAEKRLEVPGVCSMDAPAGGYAWKTLGAYEAKKGGQYMCEAAGKPGKVILQIDPRHAGNQAVRVSTLKTHYATLVQTLKGNGYKDLKGEPPKFEPPIPDDVAYSVGGTSPDGKARFFNGHTMFGNHTYFLQSISTTLADAERLGGVAKSLKEPKEGK